MILLAVVTAICAISCASLLIRIADAPPLSIAFYRVLIATCLYGPVAIVKGQHRELSRSQVGAITVAGSCLAAHFGFWITSLFFTSVASSVSLVNTSPIFVILLSKLTGKFSSEGVNRPGILWIGVILGILGSTGLAGSDLFDPKGHSFTGDLLAIMGAVSLAGYLLAGRTVGSSVPFALYLTCVYGIASVILFIACFLTSSPLLNFRWNTFFTILLIGIVPQGIGHSLLNWTLRRLPASLVSLFIIAEPIGATILAATFLKEYPSITNTVFMLIIIAGILISQLAFSVKSS